jgi:hypothetical protein
LYGLSDPPLSDPNIFAPVRSKPRKIRVDLIRLEVANGVFEIAQRRPRKPDAAADLGIAVARGNLVDDLYIDQFMAQSRGERLAA